MGKSLRVLIFFLIFQQSFSQIERDKALHFVGGGLFGLAGAGIAKEISDGNRWWTFAGSVGGATLVGLGKEAIDASQSGNQWDNDDLLATILGGVTVGITIDLFTDHKKNKRRNRKGNLAVINKQEGNHQINRLNQLLRDDQLPALSSLSIPTGLLK